MARQIGVDACVEQLLHRHVLWVRPQRVRIVNFKTATLDIFNVIDRHTFQIRGATGVHIDFKVTRIKDHVIIRLLARLNQPQRILKTRHPTAHNAQTQPILASSLRFHNRLDLLLGSLSND